MTDGRALFMETTDRDEGSWAQLARVSQRSWEQRAVGDRTFIPSEHVNTMSREAATVQPRPAPEVPARPAEASEIPGGARIVIKNAQRHGWEVAVSYCRGPWTMQAEHVEDEEGAELINKFGQADSILVRGSKSGHGRFAALWLRKPWTKAGQKRGSEKRPDPNGGYQLELAQIRPRPADVDNGIVNSDGLKAFIEKENQTDE